VTPQSADIRHGHTGMEKIANRFRAPGTGASFESAAVVFDSVFFNLADKCKLDSVLLRLPMMRGAVVHVCVHYKIRAPCPLCLCAVLHM
jgi:hypothetical protein